jgi:hypothetical protein
MAAVKDHFVIANPTKASITVAGVAIPAGAVRLVEAKEEAKENQEAIYKAICAGCTVTTNALKNGSGEVATATAKVVTAVNLSQTGGYLIHALDRSTVSIGSNAKAVYGQ